MDLISDFFCICLVGFTGKICEVNIDDCRFNMCMYNFVCVDEINFFKCKCVFGFLGRFCEVDINECIS